MAKKTQKQKQEKNDRPLGYGMKGVPSWIFSEVSGYMGGKKISPKLRSVVYPIMVYPADFWQTGCDPCFSEKSSKSILVGLKKNENIAKKYRRLDENNYKHISTELSKYFSLKIGGQPRLVIFMTPNKVIRGRVVDIEPRREIVLGGMKPRSVRSEPEFHFLDNVDPALSHYYKTRYREQRYSITVVVDGIKSVVLSNHNNYKISKIYDFVVTGWYQMVQDVDVPYYYNWEDKIVKPNYDDVYELLNNLKSYKDLYFNWLYDDQTNDVILSSLIYMELGVPCFNLVIFADARCGKSMTLKAISMLFDSDVNFGSLQTVKGLVGGFVDKDSMGAMMSSNFVFLCDEFFRTELGNDKNKSLDSHHLDYIMSKTMEFLEHSEKVAHSGNFTRRVHFDKSFIATNNLRDLTAFGKSFSNDPASFIRFSFMALTPNEKKKLEFESMPEKEYVNRYIANINKSGFNTKTLAKSMKLIRSSIKFVKVPNSAKSGVFSKLKYCDRRYSIKEKVYAMLKIRTLMNYIIENDKPFPMKHSIKPTEKDIEETAKFINRLIDGFKSVCGVE